jgi:hypothetical protein
LYKEENLIKQAAIEDLDVLSELAALLWNRHTVSELKEEFKSSMSKSRSRFFLKYLNNVPVGFACCQLRNDYVEGAKYYPVGYLEGIFIKAQYRGRGYAGELLSACENWARQQGCREFASDCEQDNANSFRFHIESGFREANRIVCFVKELR